MPSEAELVSAKLTYYVHITKIIIIIIYVSIMIQVESLYYLKRRGDRKFLVREINYKYYCGRQGAL